MVSMASTSPPSGFPAVGDVELWGIRNPFYVALAGLVVAFLVARWITESSFGVTIRAIRDDEARVEMLGYNIAFIKTVLLVIACVMAGFAGSLYTTVGFVSPTLLGVFFSTQVLVWVGIGGRGTLVGAGPRRHPGRHPRDCLSGSTRTSGRSSWVSRSLRWCSSGPGACIRSCCRSSRDSPRRRRKAGAA